MKLKNISSSLKEFIVHSHRVKSKLLLYSNFFVHFTVLRKLIPGFMLYFVTFANFLFQVRKKVNRQFKETENVDLQLKLLCYKSLQSET